MEPRGAPSSEQPGPSSSPKESQDSPSFSLTFSSFPFPPSPFWPLLPRPLCGGTRSPPPSAALHHLPTRHFTIHPCLELRLLEHKSYISVEYRAKQADAEGWWPVVPKAQDRRADSCNASGGDERARCTCGQRGGLLAGLEKRCAHLPLNAGAGKRRPCAAACVLPPN